MFALPWPGVRYCIEALGRPRDREEAVRAIALAGSLRRTTAYEYLRLAHRLGLVRRNPAGEYRLAMRTDEPQVLLAASTLVRLFHAWHAMDPEPLRVITAETNPLRTLGIRELGLLRSADAFARRIGANGDDLPPKAALLLEIVRLWTESKLPFGEQPLWSAVDAFRVFKGIHALSGAGPSDIVDQFVRTCMLLYGKNALKLAIVQYALDANRPFAAFRTQLGYIKWIHSPAPFRGVRDAEPVQATRKLISAG